MMGFRQSLVVVSLVGAMTTVPRTAATDWEIEPQPDARVPLGTLSVVGATLGAEGISFVLNHLSLSTPVQVTLAATGSPSVDFSVYKDRPEQPLLLGTATRDNPQTFRFRTGDKVYFQAKGEDGAELQLLTWVGPEIQIEAPEPFVAMDAYLASHGNPTAPPAAAGAGSGSTAPQPGPTLVLGPVVSILLGLILLALVAIVVLLWRKGKGGAGAAILILAVAGGYSVRAAEKGVPKKIDADKEAPSISEALKKLKEQIEPISKGLKGGGEGIKIHKPTETTTGVDVVGSGKSDPKSIDRGDRIDMWSGQPFKGGAGFRVTKDATAKPESNLNLINVASQAMEATNLMMAFLEQFGLIDPREAAIRPNMNPPGMPQLPSRCYRSVSPDCYACYRKAANDLNKAQSLLEEQYVIYKQTELAAGRIIELADAAAGLSPYAKLVWTVTKNSPTGDIAKAQAKLYATYDTNYAKLIKMVNDALIAQGACEREGFNDLDWYNRYGGPFYTFVRERYTRK